jgi:hypothetical protein
MVPDHIDYDGKKGWLIVHICETCGKTISNKTAPDDNVTEFEARKADPRN